MASVLFALVVALLTCGTARADTLVVTNLTDAGGSSLREQISEADPGDTITFSVSGTITLNGELVVNKDLSIVGPGAEKLTVSGGNQSRVFRVDDGTAQEATVEISGLTASGGNVTGTAGAPGGTGGSGSPGGYAGGGGILNEEELTLRGVAVTGNRATGGAGGAGGGGSLAPDHSEQDGGPGGGGGAGGEAEGGGILNRGTLTVEDSTLSRNAAAGGAGARGGDGGQGASCNHLRGCGRTGVGGDGGSGGAGGSAEGGAVYDVGELTVVNSTFDGNSATAGSGGDGGGGGSAGLGAAGFNVGGDGGSGGAGGSAEGGAMSDPNGDANISSATVSSNAARQGTGGYGGLWGLGDPSGANGNPGAPGMGRGGGIFAGAGTAMENSLVATNTATTSGPDILGPFASQGSNLVGDVSGAGFLLFTDIQNGDPKLGPLQDNGGQTHTRALLEGSGALDAGNTATAPPFDQRGVARPQGSSADIGAYEVDATAPTVSAAAPRTRGASITVRFSEPMDPATLMPGAAAPFSLPVRSETVVLLAGGASSLTTVPATVRCTDSLCNAAILDPDGRLGKQKKYTVRVEGAGDEDGLAVADRAGNALPGDYTKSFKTGTR